MVFLYDRNTLKIMAVYSGNVSQLELMQGELFGINMGEFSCQDAPEVLSSPNDYKLTFVDGEPITWRKKPEVKLELSATSIIAGEEVTLTVTATEGAEVTLLFNNVPQVITLDTRQALVTLAPTETMFIEIKPELAFFRGDAVRLEVLPV